MFLSFFFRHFLTCALGMTVDTLLYNWLLATYGKAWRRMAEPVRSSKRKQTYPDHYIPWNNFNPYCTVLMVDGTMKLKYLNGGVTTGIGFMNDQLMKESICFLNQPQGHKVFFCLDLTPRQINKVVNESKKPKKEMMIPVKVKATGTTSTDPSILDQNTNYEINDDYVLIDNHRLPDDWEGFINNKRLFPELIHYITTFLIDPKSTGMDTTEHIIQVPIDKRIYFWGGSLRPLPTRSERVDMDVRDILKNTFEGSVFYVGNALNEEHMKYERVSGRCVPHLFNLNVLDGLKEAELSVLYFLTTVPDENVTVFSGDRDLIFQLLLQSRNRFDPNTGQWRNRVTLRIAKRSTKEVQLEEAMVEEIDINILYELINRDKRFDLTKGITSPVLLLTALDILIESDFIGPYGCGLGTINVNNDMTKRKRGDPVPTTIPNIPTILFTFLNNPTKYANMIYFMVSDCYFTGGHKRYPIIPIRVDETVFIQFTRECYYHRHADATATAFKKKDSDVTVNDVRLYLSKYHGMEGKSVQLPVTRNKRMLVQRMIRVYARRLLWTLNYWMNMYREDGKYPLPPIVLYKGLSFYGYIQNGFGSTKVAKEVSPFIHLDLKYVLLDSGSVEDVPPKLEKVSPKGSLIPINKEDRIKINC